LKFTAQSKLLLLNVNKYLSTLIADKAFKGKSTTSVNVILRT